MSARCYVRFTDDLNKLLMKPSMDCAALYQAVAEEAHGFELGRSTDWMESIACLTAILLVFLVFEYHNTS